MPYWLALAISAVVIGGGAVGITVVVKRKGKDTPGEPKL
jgi:hypothetical protein